ncbi:MAG: SEC-C domain-containing protein [Candidatus Omnitrophica bacterium]|nr:SEC-C domain-containing protein [Candidatus Omnitrophota bacterium]
MDNIICKRELQDNEVAKINLMIKLRSKQFLAAENKEWLYPEKFIQSSWTEIGKVLLPPKDKLYNYGGEVYGQNKDGTYFYSDEYGRTHPEANFFKKEPKEGKIGVNDPCPCGSAKKYKRCCYDKTMEERSSWTELSIRERNLMFFRILTKILELDKKDWTQIRREFSDDKIIEIHKVFASLWPTETDLMALLPKPDKKISRALYSGLLDPRVAYKDVAAFSLYADEILIINPFANANVLPKEYNPINNPSTFRQETLKNILFFISFMPLIEIGKVNMIPDPMNFDFELRQQIMEASQNRCKTMKIDEKVMLSMKKLAMEDVIRGMFNLPDERIRLFIKHHMPEINDEQLEKTLVEIKINREQDPLASLQLHESDEEFCQMHIAHLSPNLELGLFLAQSTGSFILTYHQHRWFEICESVNNYYGDGHSEWQAIEKYMTNLEIDFVEFPDQKDLLLTLKEGELQHIKTALKHIWCTVQKETPTNKSQIDNLIQEMNFARKNMSASIEKFIKRKNEVCPETFKVIQKKYRLNAKIAPSGHSASTVYRLLLAHAGHEKYLKSLPLSLYIESFSNQ